MKLRKVFMCFILAIIFLASCTNNKSDSNTKTSNFEAMSLKVSNKTEFNYYLYTPSEESDNLGLIIYLHGGSGMPSTRQGDLSLLTDEDGLPKFVKEGQISPNSYIVFPQLPYGYKGWSNIEDDLFTFIDLVSTKLNCNKNKISITGHSMGGKGTWDIALASPNKFYKIAPLSGNVTLNEENLNTLKNSNIWAFVGSADTIVDPQSSIDFIDFLSVDNKNAKITVIDGYTHFDVPNVYLSSEYNLLDWLVN